MGEFLRPASLGDALAALDRKPWEVLAGGTDFYPARAGRAIAEHVLDISALDPLRGIEADEGGFRIGALVTWSDLREAALPACFDGLKLAAREIGGPQVQNAGTLCGNLCNASPAADGIPNLLALDAEVELRSLEASRRLPLADFVLGNRRTARRGNELMTAVYVPKLGPRARSTFLKLGSRRYLVISTAMVAAVVESDRDGCVTDARFAVGACSEVALRLPALEAALTGLALDAGLADCVTAEHVRELSPIDDTRGSAEYRRDAVVTLLRRSLEALGGGH
jgi:CO/xanthine dehydrogenase FAD-binding subunit